MWSDGPSCEFRNQFCTGKLLYEMSQLIGRVSFWKYFAAGHGKGVCDGIGGSLKARVAEHCRGKKSDNVTVQTFEDFFEVGQRLCPKVTLFKLSKEDVQMTTETDKPWENSIPIPGISSVHFAKCGIEGTVQTWKLPGEEPLKSITYSSISPAAPPTDQVIPSAAPPTDEITLPAAPQTDEVVEFVDRGWYVVEFKDGKYKKNYMCQLIGGADDDVVQVNSYLKVTQGKTKSNQIGKLFRKYPEEEVVSRLQFLKMLPTPEFKTLGRILFDDPVGFNVK